jgi:hypothetical protein
MVLSVANGIASWHVLQTTYHPPTVEWNRLGLSAVMFLGNGVGLLLLLTRNRFTPAFFSLYLGLSIPLPFADPDIFATQVVQLRRLGLATQAASHTRTETLVGIVLSLGVSLIWLAYWLRSRRVREVFGSVGLQSVRR